MVFLPPPTLPLLKETLLAFERHSCLLPSSSSFSSSSFRSRLKREKPNIPPLALPPRPRPSPRLSLHRQYTRRGSDINLSSSQKKRGGTRHKHQQGKGLQDRGGRPLNRTPQGKEERRRRLLTPSLPFPLGLLAASTPPPELLK